jgi:CRISPR-associated endonuclease/helicase Cas3
MDYEIALKPVYSQTVTCPEGVMLPAGWSLVWQQVETLKALRDPNVDVIFNASMTGDGKSLAAQLEILAGNTRAIALYPTNELARDQERQTQAYIQAFCPDPEPRVNRLSGAMLELYAENAELSKAAAIRTQSSQTELLLTNPDILHYLYRGAYITQADAPDSLYNYVDKNFDVFIFDEFHVYAAPQVASIINTMLLIRATNRHKKFLFLSATPDSQLMQRLEKVGFRCRVVNPLTEGKYEFPETAAIEQQLQNSGWRQVAQPMTLRFIPQESAYQAAEVWLKENVGQILQHFQDHPSSKGAIILNSIAAVKRLVPFFQDIFQPQGWVVGENTGLSGQTTREQSLAADLVFGTSTIDVGVDFKINFLLFESADAGNFIQRLGRLGRHDQNAQGKRFDGFSAYAFVPKFLVERLFLGEAPVLVTGERYDRPSLNQAINEKYRQINDFRGYYKRWGAVQSFRLCLDLNHKTIRQAYAESREQFQAASEVVFDTSLRKVAGLVRSWGEEWQQLSGQKTGNPIAEDASRFRGGSVLQCGLYDLTEVNELERFKTYDLPGILSNLEIELLTEAAFMRTLAETASRLEQPIARGHYRDCLAFIQLKAYREVRLNWKLHFPGNLETIANAWRVQVLRGLEVWQPENPWAAEINKKLRNQALVSYVLPCPVAEVRQRLRLPMHFQIYPLGDQYSFQDPTPPYSVAFGQSALLLDTLAYWLKGKGGEIWVV